MWVDVSGREKQNYMSQTNGAFIPGGFDYQKRCLLHGSSCVPRCPRNMHPYHTRCDRDTLSQRTCRSPLVYALGYTCGWSRCDCNGDLLLDEESMDCVTTDLCPVRKRKRRRRIMPRRKFKDIGKRVNDDEE